jgi:hypothetical protein
MLLIIYKQQILIDGNISTKFIYITKYKLLILVKFFYKDKK